MTTGERLRQLAGVSGTAATLLLLIGAGGTSGEALVKYSGLPTNPAAVHLMHDVVVVAPRPQTYGGGGGGGGGFIIRSSDTRQTLSARQKSEDKELLSILAELINNGTLH